ncbi:serine O-acetyltransferase EpsC [Methylovulum psychrotolerans]|uniref:serine O-acetyltransferase n=1 Tax=Methylovulum psychrotolerans TaxID=1704499 RepID=A0A1Z4C3V2_9GAMM|nr:serine O-acetyltransferase EpsC [Methylovulum psychrotolerans]ASF48227.1 serine acetyltransferase [Methylovulum psychrotolerans]
MTSPLTIDKNWGIETIVSELRVLRDQALANRHRQDRPPKMPSRKALQSIMEGLSAVLFPNRLGSGELSDDGVDYFVGHSLDVALRALYEQLRRECRFHAEQQALFDIDCGHQAAAITRQFAAQLPAIRALLDSDLVAAYEGDPAATGLDEVLVCYPGLTAIIYHRIAHALHRLGASLVARMIAQIAHSLTGIDIHPGAVIGARFFIDHGTGVVIGETAVIGEHVRLYQAVTLGAKRFPKVADGSLLKGNARHPIVEDDVVIYAGATLLGRITIGKGSSIGGNVWLTHSVAPGSTVTQSQVNNEPQTYKPPLNGLSAQLQ